MGRIVRKAIFGDISKMKVDAIAHAAQNSYEVGASTVQYLVSGWCAKG
jgi:O-acetyl-ADP-ribose deacetylase (regulator of RNase III)